MGFDHRIELKLKKVFFLLNYKFKTFLNFILFLLYLFLDAQHRNFCIPIDKNNQENNENATNTYRIRRKGMPTIYVSFKIC